MKLVPGDGDDTKRSEVVYMLFAIILRALRVEKLKCQKLVV